MAAKRILLIVGGGIAAYKSLDLIRRLRERGCTVRIIMTDAAQQFVTPLAAGALSNDRVFTSLFDLDDEREIGHIRLARDCDAIIVAPATADLMAKMAVGLTGDLATAVLLATDKPILAAPAMNPAMWHHPATQRNVARLAADGVQFIGPNTGEMAERNEAGTGRMAEASEIANAALTRLAGDKPTAPLGGTLAGRRVLITAGPTHEAIDPVRYIANRSSGKQGYAIAAAAVAAGGHVTLISGPVELPDVPGAQMVRVTTALEMLDAAQRALPADLAIFTAAVADWRPADPRSVKIKKTGRDEAIKLTLLENPDILASVARHASLRPTLVIGFAAETGDSVRNGTAKLASKGADWIVANDVSAASGVMGGDFNTVNILTANGSESWPRLEKSAVAAKLIERAAAHLAARQPTGGAA